ncbi:MAG TPA: ribose-5-phosphate isomerase RpiA [Hyphomicrobium sp.]|nr:ribose-5-phosphate isomerase RpiA [Hyphomicrobium sp.]
MSQDAFKVAAAEQALRYVEDGMRVGLGTGSTAAKFVDALGRKVAGGLKVVCVATSQATQAQAEALGIPMSTLDEQQFLDLTVDGADEIDGALRLIKGGGGALLREKIVATASASMIVIADASKHVATLGAFPLPLEVVPFGLVATRNMIAALAADAGCEGDIRVRTLLDGKPFITDNGNFILDCHFGRIDAPEDLDEALKLVPGVVENGLFIGIVDLAIIAGGDGVTVIGADEGELP